MNRILVSTICLGLLTLLSSFAYAELIESLDDLNKAEVERLSPLPQKEIVKEKSEPLPLRTKKKTNKSINPAKGSSKKSKNTSAALNTQPIKLQSDGNTTYSRDGGTILMRENVIITQGNLRMQSDQANVFFDPSKKQENGEKVSRVEIEGHVKVSRFSEDPSERITAHGDRAIFLNASQKVRLVGRARLFKGGHLIKGREIVYDLQSGLITVDEARGVVQPRK